MTVETRLRRVKGPSSLRDQCYFFPCGHDLQKGLFFLKTFRVFPPAKTAQCPPVTYLKPGVRGREIKNTTATAGSSTQLINLSESS